MPPKKRNQDNKGLPARWRLKNGAYYYRVPPGLESQWEGKKEFRLGKTLADAYRTWGERVELAGTIQTIGQLLDRYALDVIPGKSPATQYNNRIAIGRLKSVFDRIPCAQMLPKMAYKYIDLVTKKHGRKSANNDYEVLSHAFTMAIEWGVVDRHPLKGQVVKRKGKPRDRYVQDWELDAALSVASPMLALYIELKLMTGLRRSDLLRLQRGDIIDGQLIVKPHKTEKTTGKTLAFTITPELDALLTEIKKLNRKVGSMYLFATRDGKCYINEETEQANGFDSLWQRFQAKALKETALEVKFQERDLRAKSASDDKSEQAASERLGHSNVQTTRNIYRRLPSVVTPLNRKKS